MKLKQVHVTEFQSIRDSNSFEIGDVTCLVGKNEAGKTAVLQALYRLNPYIPSDARYDVTTDYPRAEVTNYEHETESGARQPAVVVRATYQLEAEDLEPLHAELGADALANSELTLTKGYTNEVAPLLEVRPAQIFQHLATSAKRFPEASSVMQSAHTPEEAIERLETLEPTSETARLIFILSAIRDEGFDGYIFTKYLQPRIPKFLYFDEYYQMRGFENIEALQQRVANGNLLPSDHPMLGLIAFARLDLNQLLNAQRTQELVNKLEGAGNLLSRKMLQYWSQNKHLQMRFDVRPARPGDPAGMTTGTNIWAGVYDSRHMVTTNLGTRSRGFVWFFSFLAWYSQLQRRNEPVILLLDEPGLTLHGKAQEDLLRYFEHELKPHHQLLYTTHSPFMVDPRHFDRVRIVQDKGIDADQPLPPEEDGTKVITEVLDASGDSLFPLQGALGYEMYQTLFVGPNNLVVEGVSDLMYLQIISALLEEDGREGLDPRWTITPVGGSDKVPTFVALLGAQKGLKIATLIDIQKKDHQTIENLYKRKLLKKNHVLTFADFTGTSEADIEDMFEPTFYLQLVNAELKSILVKPVTEADLNSQPRILSRLEAYFAAQPMPKGISFSHYRPARHLVEQVTTLKPSIPQVTLDRFENAFKKLNALL